MQERAPKLPEIGSPARQGSLVEVLRTRARETPDGSAYVMLADGEREEARWTWGELDRRARGVAAELEGRVRAGDRALLLYPPGLDFVAAFFGCLYARVVAVPCYPPHRRRSPDRLRGIARDCEPRVLLGDAQHLSRVAEMADAVPELARVEGVATDRDPGAVSWEPDAPRPEELAFLQYTSGSTAAPKGVMVTHDNLVRNQEMIRRAFDLHERSVIVSWLPLYHDMGLIGTVLQPLWVGASCVLMSPVAFLQSPVRWLWAIDRYRGTTSGGPDFAFGLCVERVKPEDAAALDLSTWSLAFSGAEPVRPRTLERFAAAFAPSGFRAEALYPCYGLAEATLFVTGGESGSGPVVREWDAAALERGTAEPAETGADERGVQRLAGCGRAWLGQRVVVADPETRRALPEGVVGEIWVSGPSVAAGYWRRAALTEQDFGATLADGEPDAAFLRTGDLGFLAGGELFVTGRAKDLIIVRGRNLYPQDLELTAGAAHPGLRAGGGAAFSVEAEGEERVVVVHELAPRCRAEPEAVLTAVRDALVREHDVSPHDVVLVEPRGVPKTSSGKIRRRACRERYLSGALPERARLRPGGEEPAARPPVAGDRPPGARPLRERIAGLPRDERVRTLRAWIGGQLGRLLRRHPDELDPGASLAALGLDSVGAAELQHRVGEELSVSPPFDELLGGMTPADLLDSLVEGDAWSRSESLGVERSGGEGVFPLSHGQRALWFLHRLDPAGAAYNIVAAARLDGEPDADRLRRALEIVVARHPQLRATFHERGGRPIQRVAAGGGVDFRAEDRTAGAGLEAELAREGHRPFDLEAGPLLRVRLWRAPDGTAALLVAVHHLVADFVSLSVLARELHLLYSRGPAAAAELPEPRASYADFVLWEDRALEGDRGTRAWAHWLERLEGALPVLDLPTDRPRGPVRSERGGKRSLGIDPPTVLLLRAAARARGVTLHALLMAAFQSLLHRLSGQDDVLVGVPAASRPHPDLTGVVGYFANPLVLRGRFEDDPAFGDLMGRIQEELAVALEHRILPFSLLAERLVPERDPSRTPIFQAMLVYHRRWEDGDGLDLGPFAAGEAGARARLGDLTLESVRLPDVRVQFELTLMAAETEGGGLLLSLLHDADLYDGTTAERMVRRLGRLLEEAGANPRRRVGELSGASAAERHQVVLEWNDTAAPEPEEGLHHRVRASAARAPDAVALVCGDEHLSYRELVRRAEGLSRRLRRRGVGPEDRVGVLSGRDTHLVPALLGVLEAGGAYVPLDPSYPPARLRFLAEDADVVAVLADPALADRVPAIAPLVPLGEGPAEEGGGPAPAVPSRGAGRLAYLIYTSGSTGAPKGVAIEHRSAAAFVSWAGETFGPHRLERVLAGTSIGFDLSIFEIFATLAHGGTVVLADSVLDLAELPGADRLSLVNTVPSALAELLAHRGLPAGPLTVNLAGEPLPRSLAADLLATGSVQALHDLYGPSEATTYSTFARVRADGPSTIGRPIAGTRVHLLDARGREIPFDAIGELCVAGLGVARGYLDRPRLTAERFVPDPFSHDAGGRLYRTGDLARRRADGGLVFIGRADHQVKLRGFRIELGEVEAALRAHPAVDDAVAVVPAEPPGGGLVAYVAAGAAATTSEDLIRFLRERLPEPMVPAEVVMLEALPRTPHGKVDRRALPEPRRHEPAPATPASDPVEGLLVEIWSDLLGGRRVGADDDFFAAGGHSLLAVRALSRIEGLFGVELPLSTIFRAPTPAALARLIEEARAGAGGPPPPFERADRSAALPLSFAQERLWFLQQMEPESPAYHVPGALDLRGPLDLAALRSAVAGVVRRHESLRTRFPARDGAPRQEVVADPGVALPLADLSTLPPARRAGEERRLLERVSRRPFDLAGGPLVRTLVTRRSREEHAALVVLHHLVADGVSLEIVLREVGAGYRAALLGGSDPPPPRPFQYADFAAWQRRAVAARRERDLAFWRDRLDGVPVLDLPTDRPRTLAAGTGGQLPFALPPELVPRLRRAAAECGATLYMVLLGAFAVLLSRTTGEDDLPVGSPLASRRAPETEGMVGLLINTVVLRCDLAGEPTGRRLVDRLRARILEAHAHGALPFERLVEDLQPERRLNRSPLFQVMLAYFAGAEPPRLHGLEVRHLPVETGAAKFDLTLWLRDESEAVEGWINYRSDLFDRATVGRWSRQLVRLLEGLADRLDAPIGELSVLAPAERHQLLVEWQGPEGAAGSESFLGRFSAQARRTPDRIAVADRGRALSFGALAARSDAVATGLRRRGIGGEDVVGLLADRSAESLVAILGVLGAGAAYLPLDPGHPPERRRRILEEAGARSLLSPGAAAAEASGISCLRVGELAAGPGDGEEVRPHPAGAAYVLFTSGSTGEPKGVAVSHASVANLAAALREAVYGGGAGDGWRIGCNAPLTFDASVKQVIQLADGHTLHPLPDAVRRDGEALAEHLAEQRLDAVDLTPAQLEMLAAGAPAGSGNPLPPRVLVGGEALDDALWRWLARRPGTAAFNLYGPTECTVDATARPVAGTAPRPLLGRPLRNLRVTVRDAGLRPSPIGAPGELVIGGAGVARGYAGRPALTAERFVPDPDGVPGARAYRTGDRARTLAGGEIEFLGRIDRQIKLRGLRLEPGEVEAVLEGSPRVERAVVTLREIAPGDRRLVAYLVAPGLESTADLLPRLRELLPEAVVPSVFVWIPEVPLTRHGKVDLAALPAPEAAEITTVEEHVPPRTEGERRLAALWDRVLGTEGAGLSDDFFQSGGHSLLAVKLIARVRSEMGVELPVRALFENPTLGGLAAAVAERGDGDVPVPPAEPSIPVRRRGAGRDLEELMRLAEGSGSGGAT